MSRLSNNDARSISIDITKEAYGCNNDLPPKCVRQMVVAAMDSYRAELQETDKLIEVLNLTIEALEQKADGIDQKILICQSILSPIRRLPDELLGEVFKHCLPDDHTYGTSDSQAPILLTLVCKKWRATAISTRRLWTSIHISKLCDDDDPFASIRCYSRLSITNRRLELWLMRSANLPLTLSISFVPSEEALHHYPQESTRSHLSLVWAKDGFGTLACLLASHAHRWSTFTFVGKYGDLVSFMKTIMENKAETGRAKLFQAIRKIKAHFIPSQNRSIPTGTASPIEILSAPTLRILSLQGDTHRSFHDIHWGSLTRLSIHHRIPGQVARNILRRCRLLEACALTIDSTPEYSQTQPTSDLLVDDRLGSEVVLSALRTLCIQGDLDEAHIFSEVNTPALQHFLLYPKLRPETAQTRTLYDYSFPVVIHSTAEVDIPDSTSTQFPLSTFLTRCSALESVTINPVNLLGADLFRILSACPQITSLVLDQRHSPHSSAPGPRNRTLQRQFKFNLHPLLAQCLVSATTGTVTELIEPLLPSLTSFSVLEFSTDDTIIDLLMQFCTRRIYSTRSSSNLVHPDDVTEAPLYEGEMPPYRTLERIYLDVQGETCPFKKRATIASRITQFAASMGRTVGKDLFINSLNHSAWNVEWPFNELEDTFND